MKDCLLLYSMVAKIKYDGLLTDIWLCIIMVLQIGANFHLHYGEIYIETI